MKIKRLEIVGFKSFVDKVVLDFQHGITGVVGPNGCGKSNIVDAIRWVMGEQNARNLRGRMMEDVIFGGSESRKPHGLAQVSVVFDNSSGVCPPAYKDYAEIMVTRRLHRSGDSDYLINKTPCRLLDITELFMDTGAGARSYSIIEQGKVGMLVSAKPEERRTLIEEAAGVTKFKARKKTALRKMEATRQNLVRLGDIITEVRRQIGSLKRQAKRAEKFRDIRGEMKKVELSLTGNRFQSLTRDLEEVARHEAEQAAVLSRLDTRLEEGDLQLEELELKVSAAEAEHAKAQEQIYHSGSEIQRVENELAMSLRQREQLAQQDEDFQAELDSFAVRLRELTEERATLLGQEEGGGRDLDALKARVTAAEIRLQEKSVQEQESARRFEGLRSELMELFSRTSRLANRREEIERRLVAEGERRAQIQKNSGDIQDQQEGIRNRRQALQTQLEELAGEREELADYLQELDARRVRKNEDLKVCEATQTEVRQQLERLRSRSESLLELQRNREGFGEGTRLLLADGGGQVVADLLRVEEAYETAVEMALGERLQALLAPVAEPDIAGLSRRLQEQQARASLLLPLAAEQAPPFPGGTPLIDLVKVAPQQAALLKQLLAGVYFVADISACLRAPLPRGILLVDSAGCCLDWRGLLSAGATDVSGTGLLRRQRQIDELGEEIAALETRFAAGQQELEQLAEELLELDEMKTSTASRGHAMELQALELAKDRQGLQAEEDHLNKRLALLVFDLEQIDESHETLRSEDRELAEELLVAEEKRRLLEADSGELQSRLSTLRRELDELRESLTTERVALASLQQQQAALRETLTRIGQQQKEIEQRRTQILQRRQGGEETRERLQESEHAARMRLEVMLNHRTELQEKLDRTRETYDQQRAQIDELREQLRRVRSEAEELRKTVVKLQLRQHELQVDAEHVRESVLDRYRIDLREHQVPEATEDELERQQQQFRRLQEQIEAMGEVNLMAIEEYREQEERYDFLSRQRDDLNQALDDLQKAISQINRTTRRRFKETFDLVNEKFQQVFPHLFRGGRAELSLTDEDDLLETGIEIVVQPPGKRLQSVNLLSGGEKALTAVALIFSIFLIKPTPFCILDEVDAPLDDANIDRFAGLVREMAEQAQFIIITHSKRTMAVLDTMYGVTMQEPGVSRLVSVRLNAPEKTAENDSALSA
ncbi:MAG: chromosome segregation protein SMC [Desulfuromonas sp.]|nr:MAG: chromosome segregation protein SMC [Desulfuromonas sp.]